MSSGRPFTGRSPEVQDQLDRLRRKFDAFKALAPLPSTASMDDIRVRVNQLLAALKSVTGA